MKSDCFKDGERIPVRFTCDGIDISPHLAWFNVPLGTVEIVLEMHDPDAPVSGGWTHWIVYNISPDITSIEIDSVPEGSKQARNSFGRAPYGGPCPPSGTHRYIFTLYALDTNLDSVSNLRDLHNKIDGHVLGEAKLTGLYSRR
ncbi:MAG: YbhB/YbcL family Raf kinase inhibitor-like protein [Thaumarchaeota archaeon]|nr:YbhB/YbcL family Raf kinase inhibitor-like protein [Nitrososphaerota archaeon]